MDSADYRRQSSMWIWWGSSIHAAEASASDDCRFENGANSKRQNPPSTANDTVRAVMLWAISRTW